MSMTEVSRELGSLPDTVDSISLCRAPRAEPPHFRGDIEAVAGRFQARADSLARIVRQVQVSSGSGILLAARGPRRLRVRPGRLLGTRDNGLSPVLVGLVLEKGGW